jgi:hypothetical protein
MAFVQLPSAVGLTLCSMVVVEDKTQNVTLVNSFRKIEVNELPSRPVPFSVYTVLTDGLGEMTVKLTVLRLDTLEAIYSRSLKARFDDPLRHFRIWWHVRSCSFPVAGAYEFGLHGNGELITQCVLRVFEKRS